MLEQLKISIVVVGLFVTGTINTIAKKVQFGCSAPGYYNFTANGTMTVHPYHKAWFQTYLMFVGEILCFFGYLCYKCHMQQQHNVQDGELLPNEHRESQFSKPICDWVFVLPALCDVVGSTLQGIGLLYIDASVWQMLRGSIIVFAGILSVVVLKRKLLYFQWTGMFVTVFGLAFVGVASVFKPSAASLVTSPTQATLGVFLVLLGSFATAAQMIVEEVFLKKKNYHPLHVVGMEGCFGSLIMGFIILPIIHFSPGADLNGSFENQLDAIFQTVQSPILLSTSVLLVLSIAFFNYFGMAITQYLSAVHRSLLDALRSVFVWVASTVLFYIDHRYGEPLHSAWSLVEIDGFALLVMGTLIFNKTLRLDCLPCLPPYPEDIAVSEEPALNRAPTDLESESLLAGDQSTYGGTLDRPLTPATTVAV